MGEGSQTHKKPSGTMQLCASVTLPAAISVPGRLALAERAHFPTSDAPLEPLKLGRLPSPQTTSLQLETTTTKTGDLEVGTAGTGPRDAGTGLGSG